MLSEVQYSILQPVQGTVFTLVGKRLSGTMSDLCHAILHCKLCKDVLGVLLGPRGGFVWWSAFGFQLGCLRKLAACRATFPPRLSHCMANVCCNGVCRCGVRQSGPLLGAVVIFVAVLNVLEAVFDNNLLAPQRDLEVPPGWQCALFTVNTLGPGVAVYMAMLTQLTRLEVWRCGCG